MMVSVVILTYNPDWEKFELTLRSALLQKGISLEILISDDGSETNYDSQIKELMKQYEFTTYRLIHHERNVGTVQNLWDAFMECSGEYVYSISPGDFFYHSNILQNLYQFAKKTGSNVVFGDAVYYSKFDFHTKEIKLSNLVLENPYRPELFNKTDRRCLNNMIFNHNNVVGACYFRKLEAAKEYIGMFVGKVKYLEDYPSLLYCVIAQERIRYYDQYIVWYEYGEGISTQKNSKWHHLLLNDITNGCRLLAEKFKNDCFIRDLLLYESLQTKKERATFVVKGCKVALLFNLFKTKLNKQEKKTVNELPVDSSFINHIYDEKVEE